MYTKPNIRSSSLKKNRFLEWLFGQSSSNVYGYNSRYKIELGNLFFKGMNLRVRTSDEKVVGGEKPLAHLRKTWSRLVVYNASY